MWKTSTQKWRKTFELLLSPQSARWWFILRAICFHAVNHLSLWFITYWFLHLSPSLRVSGGVHRHTEVSHLSLSVQTLSSFSTSSGLFVSIRCCWYDLKIPTPRSACEYFMEPNDEKHKSLNIKCVSITLFFFFDILWNETETSLGHSSSGYFTQAVGKEVEIKRLHEYLHEASQMWHIFHCITGREMCLHLYTTVEDRYHFHHHSSRLRN